MTDTAGGGDLSYAALADPLVEEGRLRKRTFEDWVKRYDAAGPIERFFRFGAYHAPTMRRMAKQSVAYHTEWVRNPPVFYLNGDLVVDPERRQLLNQTLAVD